MKAGRQAHLTRQKHIDAAKELIRLRERQAAEAARRLLLIEPASLQLPTEFGTGTGSNTDSMDLDDRRNHPLDDFVSDGGRFWDLQGQEVLFSAGDPNTENHEALHLQVQLERRLASLDSDSGNDPELGSTSNSLHDSDSEDGDIDDPTVSELMTELQMLGL
jgi:hypothetical protein